MPYPQAGESKASYISRFVSSEEAKSDFPDEKQRLAVAYSLYEKRNSAYNGDEHPWPKVYTCSFIEPGVVFYQDLGLCSICGNAQTCETKLGKICDTPGETVLVKQEALARMAQSFVGKPVIDVMHKDVSPNTVAKGDADGIVTRVWFDEKLSWWMCEFLVWNPETQRHCESIAYSVSCAYNPSDVLGGGQYHSLDYQEEVKDGVYTHLAVVTNPRYEGARIFVNSKGGRMDWKFWKKGDRKNAAPLDPKTTMVNVDGKDVPLQDLYEASKEPEAPKDPVLNDDTTLEVDGKEKTLGELKHAYRAKQRKNAEPEPCATCKGSGKKMAENAEPAPGEQKPLPDMRDEKVNDGVEDAAKKAEMEAKAKSDLELQQAADADKANKDAAEAAARKNADDAAAKEKMEKENADAEAAKAAEDAKKKEEERRNAGKASFAALKNAATERVGDTVRPTLVSVDDRLARGASKYGSAK